MIYFHVNQSLSCDKICKAVEKLLKTTPNAQDKILAIELKEVSYETNDMIPKLEHKKDECI